MISPKQHLRENIKRRLRQQLRRLNLYSYSGPESRQILDTVPRKTVRLIYGNTPSEQQEKEVDKNRLQRATRAANWLGVKVDPSNIHQVAALNHRFRERVNAMHMLAVDGIEASRREKKLKILDKLKK
jgi:hypothetical protein